MFHYRLNIGEINCCYSVSAGGVKHRPKYVTWSI